MENKTISKSIKIKFLFVLFLSNTSIFLFSSSSPEIELEVATSGPRVEYIVLKVSAENKTSLNTTTPVQLVSFDRRTVIKNVFVLEKVEETVDRLIPKQSETSNYLVHIHFEDAKRLNLSKNFIFFPNNYSIQNSLKRRKYEVVF